MQNVKLADPIGRAIHDVIWSKDAESRMLDAAMVSRPPLEAIDALLVDAVGGNYGKHNGTTNLAGYLVARRMRELGWEKAKQVSFRLGTVAQSGVIFTKR